MAKDSSLLLIQNLPKQGQTNYTGALDIGVDQPAFSDQWRQGRISVEIPALPNAINANANITLTLQDRADGGVTFANVMPLVEIVLPGVAANGVPSYAPGGINAPIAMPLPPGLRGPFRFAQSVDANIGGDCEAS